MKLYGTTGVLGEILMLHIIYIRLHYGSKIALYPVNISILKLFCQHKQQGLA